MIEELTPKQIAGVVFIVFIIFWIINWVFLYLLLDVEKRVNQNDKIIELLTSINNKLNNQKP